MKFYRSKESITKEELDGIEANLGISLDPKKISGNPLNLCLREHLCSILGIV